MIVSPNKGVFFLATALMCSASLYGAELASPTSDPLTRIFVGEPNRLTLPPAFPDAAEPALVVEEPCAARAAENVLAGAALRTEASSQSDGCTSAQEPELGGIVLPKTASTTKEDGQAAGPSANLNAAVQLH